MSNDYPPQPPTPPNWTRYGQPSYQPPTPPAPAPKPTRLSRTAWFIVNGFILLVVASSIGVLLLIGYDIGLGQRINTGPPPGVPYYTPAGPQPIFAPVLGGTVNDFIHQYGRSENPADNTSGIWQRLSVAGHQVTLLVSAAPLRDSQDSQDGLPHIEELSVQAPSGVTWNSSTQQSLMAVFLPSDAMFERQQPTTNGFERIYTSTQLAATFTADLFTNDAGTQTVAPGTLFEQCNLGTGPAPAGTVANSCTLSVGVFS